MNQNPTLPADPEDELMDQYLDLLDRFSPDSKQAQEFRDKHADVAGFSELASVVDDLEGSSHRATWIRRAGPFLWVASVVIVGLIGWVATWRGQEIAAAQWGWNKPGVATANQPAPVYYKTLATAAEQWTDQRPDEPVALAKRIAEFRLGCSRLIHAKKTALPAEEREWLDVQCRKWGEALDNRLEELDAGTPSATVREEIDSEVMRIAASLRGRADRLQAGE